MCYRLDYRKEIADISVVNPYHNGISQDFLLAVVSDLAPIGFIIDLSIVQAFV